MTNRPLLRSCLQLSVLAISAWMCMPMARAQTTAAYPNKPIKLIVPFPAGGGGDTLARLVMLRAAKELGQPIVVENLGGAGGNVGSAAAAKRLQTATPCCMAPTARWRSITRFTRHQVSARPKILTRSPSSPALPPWWWCGQV